MTYHIVFYEAGRYLTKVGGEIKTLSEAITQMKALTSGVEVRPAPHALGVQWVRGGVTECAMFVVNQWGDFIRDADLSTEEQ